MKITYRNTLAGQCAALNRAARDLQIAIINALIDAYNRARSIVRPR